MVLFPDQVGDYWVWRTDSIGGVYDPTTNRREIEGVDSIAGVAYFRMSENVVSADSSLQSQWFAWMRTDTTGTLMGAFGDTSMIDSATIFDPPLLWLPRGWGQLGETWEFEAGVLGGTFSFLVEDTAATVVVPAGTFTNCRNIRLVVFSGTDTIRVGHNYYADGVGEVLKVSSTTTAMGDYRYELQEYLVQSLEIKDDPGASTPGEYHLYPNYPNPFNPFTTLRFDLSSQAEITLAVYDILGRRVRTLVQGIEAPGYRSVVWDGRDITGRSLPSGIYIARLTVSPQAGITPANTKSIKMLLLK